MEMDWTVTINCPSEERWVIGWVVMVKSVFVPLLRCDEST